MARRILPQCWAQCDYLSFSLAGQSFRGHHCLIHTHTQVRLCHFSDSITSGAFHQYCSVTQQRPTWRVPVPALWIRTHSNGSQYHCRACSLTRRWCYWNVEEYYFLTPRFVELPQRRRHILFDCLCRFSCREWREVHIRLILPAWLHKILRLVSSCWVGPLWGMNGFYILPTHTHT